MELKAPNRSWVEVNLDNIAHNYHEFCRITNTNVMCVIKANGYGHGAIALAHRLENEGCTWFGVATLDEGIQLRQNGVTKHILIFNHVGVDRIPIALEHGLTLSVYSKEMGKLISEVATKQTKIHITIDSGMTRLGLNPCDALEAIKYIHSLPNIEIEGIFTHFSSADEKDRTYTNMQIDRFKAVISEVENAGIPLNIKHAANSAASIMYPDAYLDMVRIGISLYGCYPSEEVDKSRIDLKYAMQLKSRICRINHVEAGVAVSYGRLFTTSRKSKLATIMVGYADGISRVLTSKMSVLVNGQKAPVVGRICMDQCVIDITDVVDVVEVNDVVVVYGEQNGAIITVEELAQLMGTINYEILCLTSKRIPRYYTEDGKVVGCANYLVASG